MRIIVEGKIPEPNILRFRCDNCGCVFEANSNEYKFPNYAESIYENVTAKCNCPCCHETVYIYG